jgi:hypothetical protein
VFYTCAVIGGLSALVAVIATLSGSWTPLISNDSGSLSIGGATIAYGAWFYLVAGIAVLSLLVAGGIYFLGNATSARAVRTYPNDLAGNWHCGAACAAVRPLASRSKSRLR